MWDPKKLLPKKIKLKNRNELRLRISFNLDIFLLKIFWSKINGSKNVGKKFVNECRPSQKFGLKKMFIQKLLVPKRNWSIRNFGPNFLFQNRCFLNKCYLDKCHKALESSYFCEHRLHAGFQLVKLCRRRVFETVPYPCPQTKHRQIKSKCSTGDPTELK